MRPVFLHVRYVAEDDGRDIGAMDLLREAFGDPFGAALGLALVLALVIVGVVLPRAKGWGAWRLTLEDTLTDYRAFLPWVLRLSTGIALIASGVTRTWFVPHLDHGSRLVAVLFLACGFGILLGVLVRILAILALLLWAYALAFAGPDLLFATETVASLVALTALSAGRPSVDDILARTLPSAPPVVRRLARLQSFLGPEREAVLADAFATWLPFALRLGLGVSVLYAGSSEKLLDTPAAFAAVEKYGLAFGPFSAALWVAMAGLTEVLLGIGLIAGLGTRPFAALTFLVLTATLFALPDDPVAAHVTLWGTASAVFILGAGRWSVDRFIGTWGARTAA